MAKEKKVKEKKAKNKAKGVIAEFKAFVSKGNVVDMAVGVVVGGAFGAIVTAVVNVLLSVCMWPVPGGLAGLVTVLPALSAGQKAPDGLQNVYSVSKFLELAKNGDLSVTATGMYTQHGAYYYYNGLALIDWGSIINAVISFLIIAVVLFVILKVFATLKKAREQAEARALEEHYKKHPEERPAPEVVAAPAPTEAELLAEIRDLLKEKKAK